MGYFREIIAYQNPRYKETQLVELVKSLEINGWSIHANWDNDNIRYTLNPGDWIDINGSNTEKLFEDLDNLLYEDSFGGILLKHTKLDRIIWVYQYNGKYRFELGIGSDENEPELFKVYFNNLNNAINKLEHIFHIEWRTHYSNSVIRSITDKYHEGVLVLASSKRLKQYYSQNEYNGNFPEGLSDLLENNIIIAINCLDHCFSTIVEIEETTLINIELANSIEFEEDDKLLILHHGEFTMICNYNNGDYTKYRFKDIIITIPIESATKQIMSISKSGQDDDGELILQFVHEGSITTPNKLIDINEVPTHNNA